VIFYVDGFNLYHGLHDAYQHKFLWLDLVKLAQSLRPRSQLVTVKYFTASVLNDSHAQGRQDTYIDALKAQNPGAIEVIMGRYQQKKRQCRTCGATWTHYEEKETDVNIAVNLVADAAAKRAESFIIVSGDSDIAPAVRMARALNPTAFYAAAFPPKRFSSELNLAMPDSFHIGRAKILQSQLPAQVAIRDSAVLLERPIKWV